MGLLLIFCVVVVFCGMWRTNLVLNHPEKEERLREYEEKLKAGRREMYDKAAPVVGAGAKLSDQDDDEEVRPS